jgi:hypothetical protein
VSNFCRFDKQRQKKVTDFETHHRDYIDEWDQQGDLNYINDQPHTNYHFQRYLIWYAGVTRCKLKGQWIAADYVEQESSNDEDTSFDIAARLGSQIEAAPILDKVVPSSLLNLVLLIQCIMSCFVHPNVLTCE